MTPHFHLINPELLVDAVPDDAPTEDAYKKFKRPDLSSKKEQELHHELAAVVQSVLDAAGCDGEGIQLQEEETVLDAGGIYKDSPLSREATESHWIDVPFWARMSEPHTSAIYFEGEPLDHKYKAQLSSPCLSSTSTTDRPSGTADPLSYDRRPSERGDVAHTVDDAQALHFIKPSKHGEKVLGQFVEYVLSLQIHQHRTFSYAVYVCYDMARLFYFDRSGVLVSEPFRWDEPDSLLHRFVWKIAKLANAGRFEELGRDPTASLASSEEKDGFLALKDNASLSQHLREGFEEATADGWPVYKLEVKPGDPTEDEWFSDMTFPPPEGFSSSSTDLSPQPSSSDPLQTPSPRSVVRSFLVGKPRFAAKELVGRCTRGYFAYDVTDANKENWRVCFLKDSWRPVIPGRTRPEHLVYQRLRFFGATRGIGTLICGGDVGSQWAQRTRKLVQQHLPTSTNENRKHLKPVLHVHYRLVVEEIGIPLEEFESFPELSAILVDVLQAHYRAWTLAGVLHGDISARNILIVLPTGNSDLGRRRGILIDWDLSRLECELDTGRTSQPDRVGTWQFRSALSLMYPWKPYRRSDDIESFIHVYLYLVCRYHVTDVGSLSLGLIRSLFDTVSLVDGVAVGGSTKRVLFTASRSAIRVSSNLALQDLLDDIIYECSQSYEGIDFGEMQRRYGFALPPPPDSEPRATPTTVTPRFDSDDMPRRSRLATARRNRKLELDKAASRAASVNKEDPCVVQGFMSEVGGLIDLFKEHAGVQLTYTDKAVDQFLARKHEDVYRGLQGGNQSVGSMSDSESISGTVSSQHLSCEASQAPSLSPNFDSSSGSNGDSRPGPSKNRVKREIESDEEPWDLMPHRNKRPR